ncbi:MAG TPA: hypothetical protein VGJ54_01435, partial [Streptosporangiaceae bacterium]
MQAIVDDFLDHIAAQGPGSRVDLIAAFAFPLPFTVICELLGVPGPVRAPLGRGLAGCLFPYRRPLTIRRPRRRPMRSWRCWQ